MDIRSPINIVARREIYPNLIDDFWFTDSAFSARLRENIMPFTGGTFTQSVFRFRPMIGGFYRQGATHNINKVQTLADAAFGMKFLQVSIPEYKEELQVFAKGPEAVFSLLDEDLQNGLQTGYDIFSFAAWGDTLLDDTVIDGLAGMINDGVCPSWNGNVIPSYGGVTRNGTVGDAVNGNVLWCGTPTGKKGPVNFVQMEKGYRMASKGPVTPNLIIMNKTPFAFVLNKMEPQYRTQNDVRDPYWGGDGFRFHNAYVMVDEHAPSYEDGKTDAANYGLGNYKTGSIPNPLTPVTARNNFPDNTVAANLEVGEVIWMLNTDRIILRVSDDPEYGFGFSGFMGTPDSEKVVGRIKAATNLQGIGSRYHTQMYGIGS